MSDLWDVCTKTNPTAQKTHRCEWCSEEIESGEEYVRFEGIFEGRSCTVKMHPECREAELREAEEVGRRYWWEPNHYMGSYERGKTLTETEEARQT